MNITNCRMLCLFFICFYSCTAQNKGNVEKAKKLNYEVLDSVMFWSINKDTSESKFEFGLKKINESLYLNDTNTSAYTTKISLLRLFGRKNEMIVAYNNLLNVKPNFAEGYFGKGLDCEQFNELDSAILAYKEAKKIFEKRLGGNSDNNKLSIVLLDYLITRNKLQLHKDLSDLKLSNQGIINLKNMMLNSINQHPNDVGYKYIFGNSPASTP